MLRAWTVEGGARVLKFVREGPLAESSASMLRHEQVMLRELDDVDGVVRAGGPWTWMSSWNWPIQRSQSRICLRLSPGCIGRWDRVP